MKGDIILNKKYIYLIKNTGIFTISTFSSKCLVFLLVPLYTYVLTPSEYGIYDLTTLTVQLLIPILSANIIDAIMRYLMDSCWNEKQVLAVSIKYISISIGIFGCLILVNNLLTILPYLKIYSLPIFLYYVSFILYQFLVQFGKGVEHVKDIAWAGFISTLSIILFNIIFLIFDLKLFGFFYAYIAGQFLACFYLLFKIHFFKYISFSLEKDLEREMLVYAFPLIFNSISWWINNASDRYIVTWICGVNINGIYSVSYKIPYILNTLQSIFIQSWQISAVKEYESKEKDNFYSNTFVFVCVFMSIFCTILISFTQLIAQILFSKSFYIAWKYVPFLLVSSVINTGSGLLGPILTAKKNTKALGLSAICGALVNIALNIVLVSWIGAQGAAIATLISSFVIFFCRKHSLKNIVIIKYRNVIFSWILLILQSFFLIYTKFYFAQILFMIVMMLVYRNEINHIKSIVTGIIKKAR